MSKVYIYTLRHPETLEVRYVGVTRDPARREIEHCKAGATRKARWVQALRAQGLMPKLVVIETVSEDGWEAREQYWIAEYGRRGARLTNGDAGGLGRLRHTPELRAKISKALSGRPNVALRRKVFCYRMTDGALVASYDSGREAAEAVGGSRANIVRAVSKQSAASGFFWSYEHAESFMPAGYAGGRYQASSSHRAALSASGAGKHVGKVVSAETRAKQSAAAQRRWASC